MIHTQTMANTIAQELQVKPAQVEAAIRLIDEGASIPFIARYRKEATEGLTDTHLRQLALRLQYLRELDERKNTILNTIREQGQLTESLEQDILHADTKARLEDLYLPYRPKRQNKASIAKEAGLEPLAQLLVQNLELDPLIAAQSYIHTELGIDSAEAALEGARHILMEQCAESAEVLHDVRSYLWQHGVLTAEETKAKNNKDARLKFADYIEHKELIHKIPSHRALALFRGRREGVLRLSLTLSDEHYGEERIAQFFQCTFTTLAPHSWLRETILQTWNTKIFNKLELELLNRLRELADEEAIRVFSRNLHDLLLAAPAGAKVTMGLDPGLRTGIKVAVVDRTGQLLDVATIFPHPPHNAWHDALVTLAKLASKHHVNLISIGNGTGSRETERLVGELIKMYPDLHLVQVLTNEAGASVYSASELAAAEFPDLDVSLRGAVSIARRLQDPLAELVKIEPKSIGVGQYQHDINPQRLTHSLAGVVEDCVNAVGVDVNTASVALLTHVSGFNETLAKNVVAYRDEHGPFHNREALKKVTRMGEKTFQQAAGFLRIRNGDNPLDASGVHPEAYPLVEHILKKQACTINEVIGNTALLHRLNPNEFVQEPFGLPTVQDVLQELEKPGRDPRPAFKTATFKEGIESIKHLQNGMILEGIVSNVTNFGAFVNIGVHQDGLVHVSAMPGKYLQDSPQKIKTGDVVTVKVIEVDQERKRISLSMRLHEDKKASFVKPPMQQQKTPLEKKETFPKAKKSTIPPKAKASTFMNTAMADAFAKLKSGIEK